MAKDKPEKSPAEQRVEQLSQPTLRVPTVPDADLVSTGSTVLNLALSGTPNGGVPKGCFLYLVGDSGSLKTWLTLSVLAEAARNQNFKDYRFVYDGSENGALMDVPSYFGQAVAERITPPKGTREDPVYSQTVQQFYYHVDACLDEGPTIYIEDSMDALNDETDEEVFEAERHKYDTGKGQVPGSMGMAKAKTNSRNINRVVHRLRDTGSILIVISQTRDKVGGHIPGLKTRGGGRALKFYAHLEVWTSVRGPVTKTYLGKEREIGATIRMDVQKNRLCGWEGKLEIPFLKGYGIDDVGSCVDYLVEERHWSGRGDEKNVVAAEFDFEGKREALIKKIQDEDEEWKLRKLVAQVWREIIAGAAPVRKARYS